MQLESEYFTAMEYNPLRFRSANQTLKRSYAATDKTFGLGLTEDMLDKTDSCLS